MTPQIEAVTRESDEHAGLRYVRAIMPFMKTAPDSAFEEERISATKAEEERLAAERKRLASERLVAEERIAATKAEEERLGAKERRLAAQKQAEEERIAAAKAVGGKHGKGENQGKAGVVTRESDAAAVLRYVRASMPFMKTVPDYAFEDINGAVLFGLNSETVHLCFPDVGPRERGLLLAHVQTLKNNETIAQTY